MPGNGRSKAAVVDAVNGAFHCSAVSLSLSSSVAVTGKTNRFSPAVQQAAAPHSSNIASTPSTTCWSVRDTGRPASTAPIVSHVVNSSLILAISSKNQISGNGDREQNGADDVQQSVRV